MMNAPTKVAGEVPTTTDTDGPATPRYVDLREAMKRVGAARSWAVEGAMEGTPIVVLSGPEKTLKSWMNVDLAVSVASGTKWLGFFQVPEPGIAVVVDGEYGAVEWSRRVKRICAGRGLDPDDVVDRIKYYGHAHGFLLARMNAPFLELLQDVKREGADLIIVDPLRNFLDGDENSSADIIAAMSALNGLRIAGACPVVVAHHLNKGGSMSGSRAIKSRSDLIIEGTDEEIPRYSTIGRTLRTGDAITRRFAVEIEHEDDHDDAVAKTRLRVRFEGAAPSTRSGAPHEKILAALKKAGTSLTKSQIRSATRISGTTADTAIDMLTASKRIERTKAMVNGRRRDAFALAQTFEEMLPR